MLVDAKTIDLSQYTLSQSVSLRAWLTMPLFCLVGTLWLLPIVMHCLERFCQVPGYFGPIGSPHYTSRLVSCGVIGLFVAGLAVYYFLMGLASYATPDNCADPTSCTYKSPAPMVDDIIRGFLFMFSSLIAQYWAYYRRVNVNWRKANNPFYFDDDLAPPAQ